MLLGLAIFNPVLLGCLCGLLSAFFFLETVLSVVFHRVSSLFIFGLQLLFELLDTYELP
jgi:hypothetical protein